MQAVNLKSPELFQIFELSITSGILSFILISFLFSLYLIFASRRFSLVPSKFQIIAESILLFFKKNIDSAFKDPKMARKFLPVIFVMFWFLLLANQFTILPFVADLTTQDGVNVFQSPTSDLNLPLAWALMIVISSNVMAFCISPLKHIGGFLKFGELLKVRSLAGLANAFLEIFLGILDIIGEFAKIVSLSARLFGNIFAGELMIMVMVFLVPYLIPIPFIFLSIFGGLIHAFIFPGEVPYVFPSIFAWVIRIG